jgi:CheY-like chemotaxis protein
VEITVAEAQIEAQGLAPLDHEMRTLASGVVHMSEQLLAGGLDPEQRALARRIKVSGGALLSLLDDVRTLAELEAGGLTHARADFELRRAVEDVGEALAERAEEHGTELVVVIPPEVPGGVRGDAVRLRQILAKLGGFAVRSAPGGEVVLRVVTIGESAGGVLARFEVSYGTGLPAGGEGSDRRSGMCFDPFSPGLGGELGVALAKRLIDAMGGQLSTATDPDGGGYLWFELLFERRGRSTTRGLVPRIDLNGKRALLIDDSAAAREALGEMVELLAVECDRTGGEAEGIRALRAAAVLGAPYDAALVDASLPGGAATLDRIRAEAAAAGTRVVALAYPRGEGATRRQDGGARAEGDGFTLAKPVRCAQLHALLCGMLGSPPEEQTAPARAAPPKRSGAYEAVRPDAERAPSSRRAGATQGEATRPAPPPIPRPPHHRPGEPDVVAQVIELVTEGAPALLARMHEAAEEGRMDELGTLARELHEHASALALLRLSELCARLTRQARAGTRASAAVAVQAIEQEVERMRTSISGEIERRRGPA